MRWAIAAMLVATTASAGTHPAGVMYPLKPAAIQPSGLAQPLPSTKRYVLVWQDQLIPDSYSPALIDWVVGHYVGTQKIFQNQIDKYRAKNPNFLTLVYHLSFGLNGADQANPVGNITGPNKYGQEDTDTFTPWLAAHPKIQRESCYQHDGAMTRVSYPDPYWLIDIASPCWTQYLSETLIAWSAFPTTKASGIFFDVGFPPWYNYSPANWWTVPAGGSTRQALLGWWNPRAITYFNGLRAAFAPGNGHPRYLVIPNTDALVDSTDEPAILAGTDGVFTENWQAILASPGDWNLSARRIAMWATSAGKVWMADITKSGSALMQNERELLIGTYLLLRNGTSYIMIGNSDLTWWPEYEIDLGWYLYEPPPDLEIMRIAGQGGSMGGLYVRQYVAGTVLVNSSASAETYMVPGPMKRVTFSGGGKVDANGNEVAQTLDATQDVPVGPLMIPARSVVILRAASVPAPGDEGPPPTPINEGFFDEAGTFGDDGGPSTKGSSGGCGCNETPDATAPIGALALLAFTLARARSRASRKD
jgi:hypothetical protein